MEELVAMPGASPNGSPLNSQTICNSLCCYGECSPWISLRTAGRTRIWPAPPSRNYLYHQSISPVVRVNVTDSAFREPSGRFLSLLFFAMAFIVMMALLQHRMVLDTGSDNMVSGAGGGIFLIVIFSLAGIAEGLPKDRRRTAAVCRIAALFVACSMIPATFLAPEFMLGLNDWP